MKPNLTGINPFYTEAICPKCGGAHRILVSRIEDYNKWCDDCFTYGICSLISINDHGLSNDDLNELRRLFDESDDDGVTGNN